MISRIKKFLKRNSAYINRIPEIEKHLNSHFKSHKVNLGQIQSQLNNQKEKINNLEEVEFQVFSQWGDDGIIQYLVNKLDIPNKTFIEFGVEDYRESNTRFLLYNNSWTGYVIDGDPANVDQIVKDPISWACELYAECSFITKENINDLIGKVGFEKEVGILSVDIDGNDYWVWKEIDVINPVIVIAEYNSIFGVNTSWTLPYNPSFVRTRDHKIIYYGASLRALCSIATEKGYTFVGCNSKGNNAYFIRNDKMKPCISAKTPQEGYVRSKFREAQLNGSWVTGADRIKIMEGLDIYDVESGIIKKIDPSIVKYV
ncbi:hypothetical protein [Paraflavitalea pollutisoli]|uniref:hypothetical protein n=1 Tax=Paraflavitalea pollutisoli TaxID=3034143 RepID=UPI0023ED39AB|nr:hypothetical protein [Paraflavitalea sp. H1-2-19X]